MTPVQKGVAHSAHTAAAAHTYNRTRARARRHPSRRAWRTAHSPQRGERLLVVVVRGAHGGHHHGLRVPSQGVLRARAVPHHPRREQFRRTQRRDSRARSQQPRNTHRPSPPPPSPPPTHTHTCSSRVSLLSLYGMCFGFPCTSCSTSVWITLPSAVSERLILMPSFMRAPVAPVFDGLRGGGGGGDWGMHNRMRGGGGGDGGMHNRMRGGGGGDGGMHNRMGGGGGGARAR